MYGTSSATLINGTVSLDKIIFEAVPGTSNVKYQIITNAFSVEKLQSVVSPNISNFEISLNFRECKSGEAKF